MESAKTFAEWLFSTTAEIAKLFWSGNRNQIQLDPLRCAMQAVVNNEIFITTTYSLKDALLSSNSSLVQLAWQRLYQKYDLEISVPFMPWTEKRLMLEQQNGYYPMYFEYDLLYSLDTGRLEKKLFGKDNPRGSFKNDYNALSNDGWYLVRALPISRSLVKSIRSKWLAKPDSENQSGHFATFNHFLIWCAFQKEVSLLQNPSSKRIFSLPCTTGESDYLTGSAVEFDSDGCQLCELKEFYKLNGTKVDFETLHFNYGFDID